MTQQIMQEEEQQQQLPYEFKRAKDAIRIKDYKIPKESFSRITYGKWTSSALRRQRKHTHFSEKA